MNNVILKCDCLKVLKESKPLTFDIYKGEVVCLFGLNGSGKTLLLKSICGIFTPFNGKLEVLFDKNDRGVCLQFPEHLIFKEKAIDEAILITGDQHLAEALLNEIGIGGDQLPFFMSEGQKRLLFLYGYLETKNVLIFDEPFASIDAITKEKLKTKIKNAKNIGKTIIYTANRKADISIADKIVEISKEICYKFEN